jgi:hypothetical protein
LQGIKKGFLTKTIPNIAGAPMKLMNSLRAASLITSALGANASELVADVSYTSSLDTYQSYARVEAGGWQQKNDVVRSKGGWRAYAREAAEDATTTLSNTAEDATDTGNDEHTDHEPQDDAP